MEAVQDAGQTHGFPPQGGGNGMDGAQLRDQDLTRGHGQTPSGRITNTYVQTPPNRTLSSNLFVLQTLPLGLPLLGAAQRQSFALLVQVSRGQQVQSEETGLKNDFSAFIR